MDPAIFYLHRPYQSLPAAAAEQFTLLQAGTFILQFYYPDMKEDSIQQHIKLTVDAIVFGYSQSSGVSILLIKRKIDPFKNKWALPGGFVLDGESLEAAVERELQEEAGISINYLEQLFTFGKPNRDPRQRVVSVAYFGLVKSANFSLHAASDAAEASWFNIYELPKLAFDHTAIVQKAIARLQAKITYEPIGFELLDRKFLFSDLEQLYTTLLGHEIDRRNFKRKIMSMGLVIELDEKAPTLSAGRPGKLYSFDQKKYNQLKVKGFDLDKLI